MDDASALVRAHRRPVFSRRPDSPRRNRTRSPVNRPTAGPHEAEPVPHKPSSPDPTANASTHYTGAISTGRPAVDRVHGNSRGRWPPPVNRTADLDVPLFTLVSSVPSGPFPQGCEVSQSVRPPAETSLTGPVGKEPMIDGGHGEGRTPANAAADRSGQVA